MEDEVRWLADRSGQFTLRSPACWSVELLWLQHHLRGDSFCKKIFKLALGMVVYHLWKERTCRIFRKKIAEEVLHQVKSQMQQYVALWRNVNRTKENWELSVTWDLSQNIFFVNISSRDNLLEGLSFYCPESSLGQIGWSSYHLHKFTFVNTK
ncbi:hypothetical protein ACH5RR_023531 [Cinchona calisaya]|uniref:Reverse transcriptase zinc-binding domain-containing protein n=1 Tax=Cinchona calisaya TaxID=153742 RepID=A0ABD2ZAY9_9GENT